MPQPVCLSLGNQAMHASPTCPQMVPLVTMALHRGPVCSLTTRPLPLEHSAVLRAQGRLGFLHTLSATEPCPQESECILEAPGNWKSIPLECFCCLPPPPSVVLYAAFLSSHPQQVGNIRMYKACNTPGGG